jgi:SM-20-related protein
MDDRIDFRLGAFDTGELKAGFAATGRVEVKQFIDPASALRLRDHLAGRRDWTLILNAGEKVFELPRDAARTLSERQARELDQHVTRAAARGFQYRYEAIRVADDAVGRDAAGTLLDRFVSFMSSPPVLAVLREISGADDLVFADGQATSYSAGHFLTRHDDDVAGKSRRAAYVLGLTEDWRAEWGGLLMFHGDDGNIEEAFTPALGALRLFSVPQAHSVSYVAPFAPHPRLSITGWLRSQMPAP